MSKNKAKLLKAEQIQAFLKRELEVKEYLGIKYKKALVNDIVNECILYDDGVFKFDDIEKYIVFTMRTIAAYTNLELSEDIEEDYDLLCEAKLLESVINTFKKEYDDVNVLLQMKCDYILNGNTIEAQLGRFLDGLSEKLDVVLHALADKMGNFDLSNLPIDAESLKKLMSFMNVKK
ncbi:MAG: hypothetical protein IJ444_02075 [Kiritimatiellae bacterium]|nr:hypothetical protein [Kiritimatiellia bacterium]